MLQWRMHYCPKCAPATRDQQAAAKDVRPSGCNTHEEGTRRTCTIRVHSLVRGETVRTGMNKGTCRLKAYNVASSRQLANSRRPDSGVVGVFLVTRSYSAAAAAAAAGSRQQPTSLSSSHARKTRCLLRMFGAMPSLSFARADAGCC